MSERKKCEQDDIMRKQKTMVTVSAEGIWTFWKSPCL